jgi:hypothetical protein
MNRGPARFRHPLRVSKPANSASDMMIMDRRRPRLR